MLPGLLNLAADGPFQTAAMRRESARLIANLSDRLATRVVAALGKQAVHSWMSSVDSMGDPALRVHALRAKTSLAVVLSN